MTHDSQPMTNLSLLLIGCGKMGGALLARWRQSSLVQDIHVIDPNGEQACEANISWHKDLSSLPADALPSIIVIAVKPQQLDSILPEYQTRFAQSTPLYLSIAAGKTIGYFQSYFGNAARVVRAMPNTPALVGKGMTALCASANLDNASKQLAGDLMKAVGSVEWIADESLMDAVTAISGCGPAYVFLMLESLVKAGMAVGLPEMLAKTLAVETLHGSMHLAAKSDKSFEQMRIDVASPGGATEAALRVLMQDNALENLMTHATGAAKTRSKELSLI